MEFVLGIDQVIKGFDRAVPQMSVGERSTIDITAEYACEWKAVICVVLYCTAVHVVLYHDVRRVVVDSTYPSTKKVTIWYSYI